MASGSLQIATCCALVIPGSDSHQPEISQGQAAPLSSFLALSGAPQGNFQLSSSSELG